MEILIAVVLLVVSICAMVYLKIGPKKQKEGKKDGEQNPYKEIDKEITDIRVDAADLDLDYARVLERARRVRDGLERTRRDKSRHGEDS